MLYQLSYFRNKFKKRFAFKRGKNKCNIKISQTFLHFFSKFSTSTQFLKGNVLINTREQCFHACVADSADFWN